MLKVELHGSNLSQTRMASVSELETQMNPKALHADEVGRPSEPGEETKVLPAVPSWGAGIRVLSSPAGWREGRGGRGSERQPGTL